MNKVKILGGGLSRTAFLAALTLIGSAANSQLVPTYQFTYNDAITGDNAYMSSGSRYWDIDAGADSYQNDFYERPTVQNYMTRGGRYSAEEYFEYIDIVQAKMGWDNRYLYVSIDHFGINKSTKDGNNSPEGLKGRYGFRFGHHVDGRNSTLFVADQPTSNGTTFSPLKTYGHRDTNNDVGGRGLVNGGATGLSVTKQDNGNEEPGMDGYNSDIISDGKLTSGTTVMFSRIKPGDASIVEIAIDYLALGYSKTQLFNMKYLHFESIKGDPKDPRKYLWNDKYNKQEAGSPYVGSGGLSEFGTQGLNNIYELDTLKGGAVPEPGTFLALGLGGAAILLRKKKK